MTSAYSKWLRYLLIAGLFATLIIPFIFSPSMFFPFITGKNFTFRILTEILFGIYLIVAFKEPQYRPRFSWLLGAVVLFTLWAGLATAFSVDPIKSFWSNFERMEGYITVLHLLLYFFVAAAVLANERVATWFFRASVGASVVMSGYGILQLARLRPIDQGGVRLDGLLGNAEYLAIYMLFNMFFALLLMSRDWRMKWTRFVYGAIFLLDGFILFMTETRGAILGLIGGLIVAAAYFLFATRGEHRMRPVRRVAGVTLGVIAVFVVAFFALKNTPVVQKTPGLDRIASISLSDPTTISRFLIWHMAWDGFKESPKTMLVGYGQENFSYVFNKYYDPSMYNQEEWFDRAHNAFIDWAMNAGAPGFILFASLFALAAWVFVRSELPATERAALIGLVVAYAFHELFVFDNLSSYLLFFAVLAYAHARSQRPVTTRVWYARPLTDNGVAVLAPVVAVLVVGSVWLVNAPGIANAQELIQAIETTNPATGAPTDLSQNLQHFKDVLARGYLGQQEETEQFAIFAMNVGAASGVSPDLQQQYYQAAYDAMTAINKERPNDARLQLFFAKFLNQFGQYQEALQHLALASAASPNKQDIYFEAGLNTFDKMGDYQDALKPLAQAFNLDQQDDTARVYYAAGLYFAGDAKQADQLLIDRYGTSTPDDDTVLQVFFNTKQYARATAILQSRLAKNPQDVQSWVQLAQVEYTAGSKTQAIATLKSAEKAAPEYGSQLESIVTQLQNQQQ